MPDSLSDAAAFGVPEDRCYTSFTEMLGFGFDIAVEGTPILLYADPVIAALQAGGTRKVAPTYDL
jgi:predicted dehydrogenase